jgi:arylsulfatase
MSANPGGEPPNIVLVTIDSLRADYCGYVSEERDVTPTLTELATDGLAFERAIAPGPSTPESMPAIFTGTYPVGADDGRLATRRDRIRQHMSARETLPKALSRRGYTTAAFTPNPFTSRHFGFAQGFDHFQDFMDDHHRRGRLYDRLFDGFLRGNSVLSLGRVLTNFWQHEEVFKSWERYYESVVEWVTRADEPYFLWVFLMDAHNPYMANAAHRSQPRWKQFHANLQFWRESHETSFDPVVHDRLVTAYEDAVQYADAFLERLQSDLGDDPIIAVHGDHGEAFGEHGSYGHEPYLYDENVHVPLVVGNVDPGRVTAPYSLRHLPRLLTGIATGANVPEAEWYAVARSDRTRQRAVRTGSCTYLQNGRETVLDTDGEERRSETALEAIEPLREIAEGVAEATDERQRLRDAAREVSR